MTIFFELLEKKIGLARIGRIILSKKNKDFIHTPNFLVPINQNLTKNANFNEEFESHRIFITSKKKYLSENFIRVKFKNSAVIYSHKGLITGFIEVLDRKKSFFFENNVIPVIPFNVPNISISKEFSINQINCYLNIAEEILKKNQNINFIFTIKIFNHPELFDLYIAIVNKYENIKVLNFSDLFDNLKNFRNIIKVIIKAKLELDNNIVLMASGRIITKLYPMLIYLGFDLIDSSYILYKSSEGFYDTIEYLLPTYKINFLPCSCVVCRGELKNILKDKYSTEKINLLCLHNLITAKNYANKINQYLKYEDFRDFVEKSSLNDAKLISILKILDKEFYFSLKNETPITQENKTINCLGALSYFRPDFQIFREMVIDTFTPEPETQLIIILPCSSKKPYSDSKSHKKFATAIRKYPDFPNFQEIIISSPLGAIPRQLENVYPINSYDISVTGFWDEEELAIASEMLVKILDKYNQEIPIICHLEGGYVEIVEKAQKKLNRKFYFSQINNKITSIESLNSLETLIRTYKDEYSAKLDIKTAKTLSKSWHRKLLKLLDYQFGIDSATKVFSNGLLVKEKKDKNQIKIIDPITKDILGFFKYSSGQIALSMKGAEKLVPYEHSKFLVFNGEKITGNTLFRPGILEYSNNLFPNDYVLILDNTKQNLIGLGQMIVGSDFLRNSKTGRIAKVYENK